MTHNKLPNSIPSITNHIKDFPNKMLEKSVMQLLHHNGSLSERELRNHCWWAGHLFEDIPKKYQSELVRKVIDRIAGQDADLQFWCLGSFRDSYTLMELDVTQEYIDAWIQYSRKIGGFNNSPMATHFTRMYRFSNEDVRNLILKHVNEYSLDESTNPQQGDFLRCLQSEQAPTKTQRKNRELTKSLRHQFTVALIMPEYLSGKSFLQPPLGLLLTSTRLKRAGFDVIFDDARASFHSLAQLANVCKDADLVVVCTTPYDQVQNYFVDFRLRYTYQTIDYLRSSLPSRIYVAVCGSHGSVRPDLVLRDTQADCVIRGEFEQTIVLLAQALENNISVESVPHVITRDKVSELKQIDLTMFPTSIGRVDQLDDIIPDYDLVDFSRYYGDSYVNNLPVRKPNWSAVLANRGCPYTCSFCFNFWGQKYRLRDPESVVAEMELLQNKYHVQQFFFVDFTFTQSPKWVREFCEAYRRKQLHIEWVCETRCELVNEELLLNMKNAGCKSIWFGVESFADSVISQASKYDSAEHAVRAIELTSKYGITPHAFIMIGLPGETIGTLNHTIEMIHSLRVPYTQSVIVSTPRYGTPYYEQARQEFPHIDLDNSFFALNSVRGLVGTSLSPDIIQHTVTLMSHRKKVFESKPPRINTKFRI